MPSLFGFQKKISFQKCFTKKELIGEYQFFFYKY